MKHKTTISGSTLAIAAAAMFMAVPAMAHNGEEGHGSSKGHCMGVNACKGKSSCGTAKNACAGQNACKGQGYVMMSEQACDQVGGKFEAPDMAHKMEHEKGEHKMKADEAMDKDAMDKPTS